MTSVYNPLKKVRESRDYFITNKVVYGLQGSDGDGVNPRYLKRYLRKEFAVWVFTRLKTHLNFVAVFECAKSLDRSSRNFSSRANQTWRNDDVLVSIIENSQDFEAPNLRPIPTMVRLKALSDINGTLGSTTKKFAADVSREVSFTHGLLVDREAGVLGLPGDEVSNVVKGRPEIMSDVANDYTPGIVGELFNPEIKDVLVGMRIVLSGAAVWVFKEERIYSLVEGIYVFPCSVYLEFDVIQWIHDLYCYYDKEDRQAKDTCGGGYDG